MCAAKNTQDIFTQDNRPRASFVTVLLFVLAFGLVLAGFYLFALAFDLGDTTEAFWVFMAGLALDCAAFWITFGLIPGREKAAIDD